MVQVLNVSLTADGSTWDFETISVSVKFIVKPGVLFQDLSLKKTRVLLCSSLFCSGRLTSFLLLCSA